MRRTTRFKIVAVAVLWSIIAVAAGAGFLIGHGSAELRIAELKQQIATSAAPKRTCGMEIELLEARGEAPPPAASLFGLSLGGILPRAPQHLHLREMLTAR